MAQVDIRPIVKHYEDCLERHGPCPAGVDWPDGKDLTRRFDVLLGLVPATGTDVSLLDLGCGYGALYEHLSEPPRRSHVRYHGIDISPAMIAAAHARWPNGPFECRDILAAPPPAASFDYVVMNGVLTEKQSLSQAEMACFARQLIAAAFRLARVGIAFNVMSHHVDWRREDLFHWPFDDLATFLTREISRHFIIRSDYGLFEYAVLVRRDSSA